MSESANNYAKKNMVDDPFKGMSKKRTMNYIAQVVFSSMTSKGDLYKQLDQYLQVSDHWVTPNSVVLFMSIHHVHEGLRKGYLLREKAAPQEERRPLH